MTGTQDTTQATIVQPRPGKRPSACVSDAASVRRLVEQNLGLAYFLLHQFRVPDWMDQADLESSSLLALFKAATVFDPGRNVSFAAFAGRVIRNGLIHALKAQRRRRLVTMGTGDDKPSRIDLIEDRHGERERIMANAERAYDLAFRLLTPAEFLVVCGRHRGQSPAAKRSNDAELAKRLGVARQTVCSIRRSALLRLRFEATRRGIEGP